MDFEQNESVKLDKVVAAGRDVPALLDCDMGGRQVRAVNARDLHAFLQVGKDFSTWMKDRIAQYGFERGRDFEEYEDLSAPVSGSAKARPQKTKEYAITIDMAKELSMVERNEQGKKARAYFIECERVAHEVKPIDPMQVLNDPAAMRGLLLTYSEKVLALEARVEEQEAKVATLDRIEGADGSMCLTDAAKTLKVRPIDLIRFMDSRRWIYKRPQNRNWIGYHDKIAGGYLEHDDHLYIDKEGRERVSTQVKVTGKGLVKLSELLNEKPH